MSKEAMGLAQKWQQTDWNTESPMSADFAVSEANDVISALMDALREALAEQPAQQEPVARVDANDEVYWADILPDRTVKVGQLLYAEAPQPAQQEPVAYWIPKAEQFCIADPSGRPFAKAWEPLYTSPPAQRTWVGLTDEEIDKTHETKVWDARRSYARAIEAKLKEKNT